LQLEDWRFLDLPFRVPWQPAHYLPLRRLVSGLPGEN
jgi:hypothetical protein